jgi:hypothetical protein
MNWQIFKQEFAKGWEDAEWSWHFSKYLFLTTITAMALDALTGDKIFIKTGNPTARLWALEIIGALIALWLTWKRHGIYGFGGGKK